MNKKIQLLTILLTLWLTSCSAYQPPATATSVPQGIKAETLTPTSTVTVVVKGNVYVRDEAGAVQGWLEAGTSVEASCRGDWCYISGGQFDGLKFYRGCSADNPDSLGCKAAQ